MISTNKTKPEPIVGIYIIRNVVNGKIYVGKSINIYLDDLRKGRWGDHIKTLRNGTIKNKHLLRSWNKYGEDKFRFHFLEKCDKGRLIEREQHWMDFFNSCDGNFGYNQQNATGTIFSNETIAKKKEARARQVITPESNLKRSQTLKGRISPRKGITWSKTSIQQRTETWHKNRIGWYPVKELHSYWRKNKFSDIERYVVAY